MRRLKHAAVSGFTMVEVLVALAIFSLLAMAATPFFTDYMANSRLREGGNALLSESLYAQAEAVKRNRNVTFTMVGGGSLLRVTTTDDNNADLVLRERRIPEGLSGGGADIDLTFGPQGRPVPFGTAVSINLTLSGFTCSNDVRCPGLRVDGGGGMRLCTNTNNC